MSSQLSSLTYYSQVQSTAGTNGSLSSIQDGYVGLDDNHRQSLSFTHDFSAERQAIRDSEEWDTQKKKREKRIETFNDMIGNNVRRSTPTSKPDIPPRPTSTGNATASANATAETPIRNDSVAKSSYSDIEQKTISQFKEYTGVSESQAVHYLRAYDWDVKTAVKHYFDGGNTGT